MKVKRSGKYTSEKSKKRNKKKFKENVVLQLVQ